MTTNDDKVEIKCVVCGKLEEKGVDLEVKSEK